MSGIVSIMTLAALAYERYIRVVHAQVVDFPWTWRAIAHIWLYSLVWTGAPLLGWNRYTLEIHQLGCSLDWASKDPNDASFIFFFLLACFFVPVGVMIYCYGNILYAVQRVRHRNTCYGSSRSVVTKVEYKRTSRPMGGYRISIFDTRQL